MSGRHGDPAARPDPAAADGAEPAAADGAEPTAADGAEPATRRGRPARLAQVRRKPERARYDSASVHAVLDAAPFCHVGTVRGGRPVVLPMMHGRLGDTLVLHGSVAAGLFRDMRRASPVCVTATVLDGLVLARSARNHSVNYRCVTVHGEATEVTDPDELMIGMWALVEHLAPGRWEQVRKPLLDELRDTALWQVPIEDASVKARSGPTIDPQSDCGWPVWAGHIPSALVFGPPVPAEGLPRGVDPAGRDVVLSQALGRAAW
jgi:nitroimidazol reductase NimA-like FMN-containing flavoprotein (pyridoxamine 5'-phosphate oxidase superfamily)